MARSRRAFTAAVAVAPAVVVAAVWVAVGAVTGPDAVADAPLLPPPPPAVTAAPVAGVGVTGTIEPAPAWVSTVASGTGIPARALTAYAAAQLRAQTETPSCRIGWTTLAGIGSVESDHGRHGGSTIDADGVDRPTVTGPPLDGTDGNLAIADTDGGRLDGDTAWDRAVGPLQFIPTTWERYGRSATGGTPDPSNIDDAALTAATYLCADGVDMGTAAGWTAALATYNAPLEYAQTVADRADGYAAGSRT